MDRRIRRKLDMAARVLAFSKAHPYTSDRYTAAVAQLEDRLGRAQALDTQHLSGRMTVHSSAASKASLRRVVQEEHLHHLVRMAEVAEVNQPELGGKFKIPARQTNHQAFLTAAQALAANAATYQEVFVKYGLPATFLEDLGSALTSYQQALDSQRTGTTSKVGALADLRVVTDEVMALVGELDAINRYRFQKDAELKAAWLSARNVTWPLVEGPGSAKVASPRGTGPGPAPPAEGRVAPAA